MLLWTIGFVCGVIVGQLALLGVLALVRRPPHWWECEPPDWLPVALMEKWGRGERDA